MFPCQAQHTALLVPTTHAHHAAFSGSVVTVVVVLIGEECGELWIYRGGWETFTTVYISMTQKASIYVQVQYVLVQQYTSPRSA